MPTQNLLHGINTMSTSSLQIIYNYWVKEKNSIISNDQRNERDVVRISKATYLSKYGNFVDPNTEVEDGILKKTNTVKRYIKAPCMVYTKSIKQLHFKYLKEYSNIDCSRSTFVKYRPFYIEVPTEREAILLVHCMSKCTYKSKRNQCFHKLKVQPIYSDTKYP